MKTYFLYLFPAFHQHFTYECASSWLRAAFLWLRFGFVTKEMLFKALSYEKLARKTLMKLTQAYHRHSPEEENRTIEGGRKIESRMSIPFTVL